MTRSAILRHLGAVGDHHQSRAAAGAFAAAGSGSAARSLRRVRRSARRRAATSGSLARAVASPARASSPPDSSAGRRAGGTARPTRSSSSSALDRARHGRPAGRTRMLARTSRCASRLPVCSRTPIRRARIRARSASGRWLTRSPPIRGRAAGGLVQTGQAGEQGRLAGARWSDHGDRLARLHGEGHSAQREGLLLAGAEEPVQVPSLEGRRFGGRSQSLGRGRRW